MYRTFSRWSRTNASSPSISSPGSIITAPLVRSDPTTWPFLKKGPTDWLSIIITIRDHSGSRRSDVHVEDQDRGRSAWRRGRLRAVGRRRARGNAQGGADARDPRFEQPENQRPRDRRRHEVGSRPAIG